MHSGDIEVTRHEGPHEYVVIRFTWPQLRDEPLTVIARIAAVLAHRGEPDRTPHRVVPHPPPGG